MDAISSQTATGLSVDLRCPVGAKKLLGRVRQEGGTPSVVSGNLLELACRDCRNGVAKQGKKPTLVVHRFNILGEMVESEVLW
jgi:hypothetical protein